MMIGGAIAGVIFLIIFARLAIQISHTAAEVERTVRNLNELVPPARRLLEQTESDLEEIRELARRTTKIAEDVEAVTGQASTMTVQLLKGLEGQILDRAKAAVAGVKAGVTALRQRGDGTHARSSGR